MNCIVVTIGDEILYGQTIDTNSAWIGQQLNLIGVNLYEIVSISDDKSHIKKTLDAVKQKADIILITGGLGPTKDDLTKDTLTEYFNTRLVFNESIFQNIAELFSRKGVELLENNKKQAEVPESCIPIENKYGTAPGMYFEEGLKIFVSMPGVPSEMKAMMTSFVIPKIKEKYQLPIIKHSFILTVGIRESVLSQKLEDYEATLPAHIKLAYLPSLTGVRLRLTAKGDDEIQLTEDLDRFTNEIDAIISEYIYAFGEDSLEMVIAELLKLEKEKVTFAESCTGGYVAHRLTSVPGSSAVFDGGIVTYSNEVKMKELGVKKETLDKKGAVSEETVIEMVKGAVKKFNCKYGVSISGIAGPDGGTAEKPVGTVWIAVGTAEKIIARKYLFKGNRIQNIELSGVTALNMLRKFLKGQLV